MYPLTGIRDFFKIHKIKEKMCMKLTKLYQKGDVDGYTHEWEILAT
jgi:hypothetical protein